MRGGHIDTGRDLFNQRHDVTHAQDATGMALGIKDFQAVELFAGARKLDGRAGDLPHAERRAAARVAIGLGQDDAGQRQCFLESPGGVDRVLALHGIDHKQRFHRIEDGVQLLDFSHQGFINRQAAGRIDQQHIKEMLARVIDGGQRNVARLLVRRAREPLGAGLRRHGLELLYGGRAVDVARNS